MGAARRVAWAERVSWSASRETAEFFVFFLFLALFRKFITNMFLEVYFQNLYSQLGAVTIGAKITHLGVLVIDA